MKYLKIYEDGNRRIYRTMPEWDYKPLKHPVISNILWWLSDKMYKPCKNKEKDRELSSLPAHY